MNCRPSGISTMSVLSLISDSVDIVCTWARIHVILASPNVIVLVLVAVAGCALQPINVLLTPVVLLQPARLWQMLQ